MKAYEEMIQGTASERAPWYVVPADDKWYARAVVAAVVVETLDHLNLKYPTVEADRRKDLEAARNQLLGKKGKSGQRAITLAAGDRVAAGLAGMVLQLGWRGRCCGEGAPLF